MIKKHPKVVLLFVPFRNVDRARPVLDIAENSVRPVNSFLYVLPLPIPFFYQLRVLTSE